VASIVLDRVSKVFPGGAVGVRDVSLETATAGRILIDGHDVTRVPPQGRDLAMVFQSYALYPHLTVRENLAFGLRMRRAAPAAIAERIDRAAASLGIAPLLDRKPAQLSGGQRQRVALGRAIVREPRAFLFDEPLSNLDPALRVDTRAELSLLHRRLHATMVYVTHDQEEAMTLGTRIAVMRDGGIEQAGPPLEIYRRPENRFVAGFVGSPAMNFIPGEAAAAVGLSAGSRQIVLGIRPHDLEVTAAGDSSGGGVVQVVEPLGSATLVHVRLETAGAQVVRAVLPPDHPAELDAVVGVRARADRVHRFDATTGRRLD
jgi:ABC-type sugar transport system ATPase subunit